MLATYLGHYRGDLCTGPTIVSEVFLDNNFTDPF
jgi:hypothetical protein